MTGYRFLNADHSLVLTSEGHVIAWDAHANQPRQGPPPGPQPAPTTIRRPPNEADEPLDTRDHAARASLLERPASEEPVDEIKAWRDAGSPQPAELYSAASPPPGAVEPPRASTMTIAPRQTPTAPAVHSALDAIDAKVKTVKTGPASGAADIETLRDQVAALVEAVRELAGGSEPRAQQ